MIEESLRNKLFMLPITACLLIVATGEAVAELRVVALSGQEAPGTSNFFESFNAPILNNNGETAFVAFIDDDNGSEGIWSDGDGISLLRKVALPGDTAPDSGGAVFEFFDSLQFNNLGDVAFRGNLDDFRVGIYTDRERPSPSLTMSALEGDSAPGSMNGTDFAAGFIFQTMGGIHSGTAFLGRVAGQPNTQAIYSEGFNVVLSLITEEGKDAPDSVNTFGQIAQFTSFGSPIINDTGHIAFRGDTNASTGNNAMGDGGIWTTSPNGTLRGAALQGQDAPGTETTFSQLFRDPALNNDGDIGFSATLVGVFDNSLRDGVWVVRDGSVEKVVVESDDAPGTNSTFKNIISNPVIDDAGLAAFTAELDDGRRGLWKESSPGILQLIAIDGQQAPGTGLEILGILDFAVNGPGQVALIAQLSDFSSDAILATDTSGTLQKIIAAGDTVDIDETEFEIQTLGFQGQDLGQVGSTTSHGFNDLGQVAFRADGENIDTFDFFDGVFVMDVPTPGGVPGDYNGNGFVDAADYSVWLAALGGSELLNEFASPGVVDLADYEFWKMNLGNTAGAGTGIQSVPESATGILLAFAVVLFSTRRVNLLRPATSRVE